MVLPLARRCLPPQSLVKSYHEGVKSYLPFRNILMQARGIMSQIERKERENRWKSVQSVGKILFFRGFHFALGESFL